MNLSPLPTSPDRIDVGFLYFLSFFQFFGSFDVPRCERVRALSELPTVLLIFFRVGVDIVLQVSTKRRTLQVFCAVFECDGPSVSNNARPMIAFSPFLILSNFNSLARNSLFFTLVHSYSSLWGVKVFPPRTRFLHAQTLLLLDAPFCLSLTL